MEPTGISELGTEQSGEARPGLGLGKRASEDNQRVRRFRGWRGVSRSERGGALNKGGLGLCLGDVGSQWWVGAGVAKYRHYHQDRFLSMVGVDSGPLG